MTKVAVYSRISRDDAGDAAGVTRQADDCKALCERRGWSIVASLVDNDISAFSGRTRPGYERLLELIRARGIDTVLAWAPERLHRSPRELEDFIELIEATGTAVETIKAGAWDVSTSHGRLVARMLGAVSRAESERTGERVSRAHQQAKSNGFWRGPIPYGMQATATPGKPEPDPVAGPVVRDIARRVIRGDALSRIARELNEQGVRPRRGQGWTHTGVLRLLESPGIAGLVSSDGELREAAFEGVVDVATWRATRAALAGRPRGESRRPRETLTLLGSILRCAEHGHPCYGGGDKYGRIYQAQVRGVCAVRITRPATDDLVRRIVVARLQKPDAQASLAPVQESSALEAEAAELQQRRNDIGGLIADGLLPTAVGRPRLEALARRLGEIDLHRSPGQLPEGMFVDPATAWENWTMPERREIVRMLFSSITVRAAGTLQGPTADLRRLQLTWTA